jgi:hypothetical protein
MPGMGGSPLCAAWNGIKMSAHNDNQERETERRADMAMDSRGGGPMRPLESCKAFDFRQAAAAAAMEVDILLTGCVGGTKWERRPAAMPLLL